MAQVLRVPALQAWSPEFKPPIKKQKKQAPNDKTWDMWMIKYSGIITQSIKYPQGDTDINTWILVSQNA
jgi:hypothetical protein